MVQALNQTAVERAMDQRAIDWSGSNRRIDGSASKKKERAMDHGAIDWSGGIRRSDDNRRSSGWWIKQQLKERWIMEAGNNKKSAMYGARDGSDSSRKSDGSERKRWIREHLKERYFVKAMDQGVSDRSASNWRIDGSGISRRCDGWCKR